MRGVRPLVWALALALTAAILPAGSMPAAAAASSSGCPGDAVPATAFTDTLTSTHRAAIDCARWWGLVQGRDTRTFAPASDVTRGQTSAMVARLLRDHDRAPAEVPSAGFADTDGHLFEADIDLLAALGIVSGTTAATFAPDEPIDRAQMASLLSGVFAQGFGVPLPTGPVPFRDVSADNVHRDGIGRLVTAGITTGTSATTYDPRGLVSRAQMASFLTRAAGVLLGDGLVTLPEERPAADDAYASRMRATWVHLFDDSLKTRSGIDRLVAEVVAADGNTIIAQAIRRHDAYYVSDVLPRTPDPRVAPRFDVLAELLDAAHAAGIEVHAWFSVAPTTHGVYADLDTPDDWLATVHGLDAPVADRWVTRTHGGTWSDYLDPGVPEVRAHVVEVVTELAERYPVDGVHLDYVRYSSAQHGYNPKALAAYRAATGATGIPDPNDRQWSNWRRAQTEGLIVATRAALDAVDPSVALSAAVITWVDAPATPDRAGFRGTLSYTRVLQDWDRWVRRGLLDAVMPMNYYRDHVSEQRRWFDGWLAYERALAAEADVAVVPGPAGYLNHPDNVHRQVRAAMRADGAAVYSYQQPTLDGSRQIWQRLAQTRWGYHPRR